MWVSWALILLGLALIAVPLVPYIQARARIVDVQDPDPPGLPLEPDRRADRPIQLTVADGPSGTLMPGGDAEGPWRLYIPRIDLGVEIFDGTTPEILKKGPGVYPEGVKPGQHGNLCIAGHRNAHKCEFWYLDRVKPGDPIFVTIGEVSYRYETERVWVIARNDWSVIKPTGYNCVTLTTCHPLGSTEKRLVVRARLVQATLPRPAAAKP